MNNLNVKDFVFIKATFKKKENREKILFNYYFKKIK